MPRRRRISAAVRRQITERDTQRCAYCRSPMVIEHIIPLVSGGSSTPDNLCLDCYRCNEFKGSRIEAADPRGGKLTLFFHSRLQRWSEHFAWREHGDTMAGLTSCGRTTIEALRLNNDWIVQARRLWMLGGLSAPRIVMEIWNSYPWTSLLGANGTVSEHTRNIPRCLSRL